MGSDRKSAELAATTPIPSASASLENRYARTEIASPVGAIGEPVKVAADTLGPGDIIAGKYQIDRVLGEGGMGMVFAATHLQLRETVALKFMNAEAVANPEASARFVREARAAARLRGEHVCRVLDLGETDGGDRYIVIEYLDGKDLADVLTERGTLTVNEAVDYILQACEAMAEAHAAGIIHRDLKPANLFLTTGLDGTPSIKVVDFGISKLINPETNAQVVTTTRSLMGSPLYMAPEQLVNAKEVDQRSDIWALGTVLFQLIAGRTPYEAASLPEVVAQVLHNEPPKLSSLVAATPRKLDAVIARCLAKKKDDRYASVADLAADLAEVVPEASHLAMRSAAVLGAASGRSARVPVTKPEAKRKLKYILPAALIALAGAAAVVFAISRGGGGEKSDDRQQADSQAPAVTEGTADKQAVPSETVSPKADTVIEVSVDAGVVAKKPEKPERRKKRASSAKRAEAAKKADAAKKAAAEKAEAGKKSELLAPDLDAPIRKKKKKKKKKSDVLEPDL